ncbi:MAG TPA: DUF1549 domain-containing protein [Urbifossiella sp.]|nr:DUF1549 domain-containing protein [Urbifossiella sp.]
MNRVSLWLAAALLPACAPAADAAEPSAAATALAARIDRALETAWAEKNLTPAAAADDAEFLRRVTLDLAGRIPTVAEARTFLADRGADRRRRLVAGLLARPVYARHAATVWRHLLLPEAEANPRVQALVPGFEHWLRGQFDRNVPFDQLARTVLTTPVDPASAQLVYSAAAEPSPVAFYLAKEGKPENLAATTARVFLGIRLECAQCHDHPFAAWTRDQFWGLAAFFAGIRAQDRGDEVVLDREVLDRRELLIPGSDRVVQGTFPDGTEPRWRFKVGPRQTLADWVTAKNNPYFARAAVNRVWAQLFGIGLVEPVDEMTGGQDTVSHHPALLAELAEAFAAGGYDQKVLVEAITATRAYQLTSRGRSPDAPLFTRHSLRGLTGEQLYDSLATATGQPDHFTDDDRRGSSARADFLARFGPQTGRPVDHETSIVQALTLMNGSLVAGATTPGRGDLLAAVLDAPFLTERERVETVYLAALARRPTRQEAGRAHEFIEAAATGRDPAARRNEAVADIFWALLNSAEFVFNH